MGRLKLPAPIRCVGDSFIQCERPRCSQAWLADLLRLCSDGHQGVLACPELGLRNLQGLFVDGMHSLWRRYTSPCGLSRGRMGSFHSFATSRILIPVLVPLPYPHWPLFRAQGHVWPLLPASRPARCYQSCLLRTGLVSSMISGTGLPPDVCLHLLPVVHAWKPCLGPP